jgi:hypothetical protein
MGGFPLVPWNIDPAGIGIIGLNEVRGFEVPPISLEFLMKNLRSIAVDSSDDVSFILEHIMNK